MPLVLKCMLGAIAGAIAGFIAALVVAPALLIVVGIGTLDGNKGEAAANDAASILIYGGILVGFIIPILDEVIKNGN